MKPRVSIIMGSTSDLPVMEKAAKLLDEWEIPFELCALSAHRTPAEVEDFARTAKSRGVEVIIAGAGMWKARNSSTVNASRDSPRTPRNMTRNCSFTARKRSAGS